MAVTPQQRRAALIALIMTASAGGGYVAKDDLVAIGQRFCGPTPRAVIVGTTLDATKDNLAASQKDGTPAHVKLDLGQARGILESWCNPDRQRLDDEVGTKLTKGVSR